MKNLPRNGRIIDESKAVENERTNDSEYNYAHAIFGDSPIFFYATEINNTLYTV